MDNEQLGFYPTFKDLDGKCYLQITQNSERERLLTGWVGDDLLEGIS